MGIRIGLCRPQADYVTTHSVAAFAYECYKADKELKT